jgi:hypothetical protein
MNVAHDESDSFFFLAAVVVLARGFAELAFKAHDAEMSPARREIGFGKLADCKMGTHFFNYSQREARPTGANILLCSLTRILRSKLVK